MKAKAPFFQRQTRLGTVIALGSVFAYSAWAGKGPFGLDVPSWASMQILSVPVWKWVGLLVVVLIGILAKEITQTLSRWLKRQLAKTHPSWDDRVAGAIERPVGWIGACLAWFLALHLLDLPPRGMNFLIVVIQIVIGFSLVSFAYRLTDILAEYVQKWAEKTENDVDDHLVPLVRKTLKVFVVVFGFLLVVQNLGVNVMSVFAGLGLGGLAFALAAKDMCANFFGSIMILIDRPFKVGDWVVTGNAEGTVEDIGFRSTRLRTFYNSVISVPNSQLVNENIDNMGKRRYRRVKANIGLTYDTSPEKIQEYIRGVKDIIANHRATRKDYYHVVFNEYSDSALTILVYFFLEVADWGEELQGKEEVFLEMLKLAQNIGVEYAYPTQTLHLGSVPKELAKV